MRNRKRLYANIMEHNHVQNSETRYISVYMRVLLYFGFTIYNMCHTTILDMCVRMRMKMFYEYWHLIIRL